MKTYTHRRPGAAHAAPRGSVRIIAGKWRRRRIKVVDVPGLRPTPDRVRETLFAWLTPGIARSRCLDMFAGTGALGFEAASRGASSVVMLERDPRIVAALREQCGILGADEVEVIQADALTWLEDVGESFDIIFMDPPFGRFDAAGLCAHLDRCGALKDKGVIYFESGGEQASELPQGWRLLKSQRAGQVRYHLAARDGPATTA